MKNGYYWIKGPFYGLQVVEIKEHHIYFMSGRRELLKVVTQVGGVEFKEIVYEG